MQRQILISVLTLWSLTYCWSFHFSSQKLHPNVYHSQISIQQRDSQVFSRWQLNESPRDDTNEKPQDMKPPIFPEPGDFSKDTLFNADLPDTLQSEAGGRISMEQALLGASFGVLALGLLMVSPRIFGVSEVSAVSALSSEALKSAFDPAQFQPVCPLSDGLYSGLKGFASTLIGADNVEEYGPLIASVLLRIRLEVCVLESFVYEAVIPFIRQKGFSWVLPLHETVETFIAGTTFAVASNFILLGSTKIVSVLTIYLDAITGMPARFIGNNLKKAFKDVKPVEIVSTALSIYGNLVKGLRQVLELFDTFVGRYLVIFTTIYIAFKFAHFKLFNDFFP